MNKGLKITGKVALFIITPTIILLLVLLIMWLYKRYGSKSAQNIQDSWKKYLTDKDMGIVDLYSNDAYLKTGDKVKKGAEEIKMYYTDLFSKDGLSIDFNDNNIVTDKKNNKIVSGELTLKYNEKGSPKEVPITYSFMIRSIDGKMKIVNQAYVPVKS